MSYKSSLETPVFKNQTDISGAASERARYLAEKLPINYTPDPIARAAQLTHTQLGRNQVREAASLR